MADKQRTVRLAAAVGIIAVALAVYLLRPAGNPSEGTAPAVAAAENLPRLLDLGADRCVPCKMMAPILEELKVEFAGTFTTEFVDVWKNPEAAKPYGIRVIPTQIFFGPDGTELFRHEGFFGREDILAKWRELGVQIPEEEA